MNKCNKGIKGEVEAQLAGRRIERDSEGRVIINMTVKDDDGFLSPFSENDKPVISGEVAEFIENSTCSLPPRTPLSLRIHSNSIDDKEKEDYRVGIKEYYAEKFVANSAELFRNRLIVIMLLIVGVFILTLAFSVKNAIWAEVVDIVAWVLLWEATDIGIFRNRAANVNRLKYMAYMTMKVEYYPLLNEKK